MTSLGKFRHLTRCSTPDGHFVILAIDHRANLRGALDKSSTKPLTESAFTNFKSDVVFALADEISAVLIDPDYGLAEGIVSGSISARRGLLAPLEVTNYDLLPHQQQTRFIADWSVRKVKRIGGDGVKLLLFYHPDAPHAKIQRSIVNRLVDLCGEDELPFFLEPITYSLDPSQPLNNKQLRQLTCAMAKEFSGMGVDVLKLQFPVNPEQSRDEDEWAAACRSVSDACSVPWALLSSGVDYETFKLQTQIACENGASGIIAGRAVWNEAVKLRSIERQNFLKGTARARLRELAAICSESAVKWTTRTGLPDTSPGWYKS